MLENNFYISIPDEWLDGSKDDYFVLSVNGDNYFPYFNDGDLLIICKDFSKFKENDIFVYEISGAYELRKLFITGNGTELLEGIKACIPPIVNLNFRLHGFVYMRITNYRQEAANNGRTEE